MHHKTHEAAKKLFAPGWFFQIYPTMINICLLFLGTSWNYQWTILCAALAPWGQAGQTGQAGHLGATAKSKSNAPLPRPLPRSPQPFEKECSGHFSQRISGQSFPQVRLREIGFKRFAKQLCRFCFSYEFHQSLDLLPSHHNYLMIVTIRSHDCARCGREISRSSRCL